MYKLKDTDVGFELNSMRLEYFNCSTLIYQYALKEKIMSDLDLREIANGRISSRLRQVMVLVLAIVVGIIVSVSSNMI